MMGRNRHDGGLIRRADPFSPAQVSIYTMKNTNISQNIKYKLQHLPTLIYSKNADYPHFSRLIDRKTP